MVRTAKKMLAVLLAAGLVFGLSFAAMADTVAVTGTVLQADSGYALDTGDKTIFLEGEELGDDLIDQQVEVKGTISTDDAGNEIMQVESVEIK
jgi:hypothetical protein